VFARENGLEIIGEIPYDREVPRSMAYRRPLVIFSPKSISSKALMEISENVKKFLD
jgi:MinD superfamily P-loop ATPase